MAFPLSSQIFTNGNTAVFGGNTAAANTISGALQVSGGAGIQGNLHAGNLIGTGITGTLLTASQTNITALGNITALTATGISTNTLQTSGNAQIGGNLNVAGNINAVGNINIISGNSGQFYGEANTGFGALYAGIPSGYTLLDQEITQFSSSFDGYSQVSVHNISTGDKSTSDFVATADNGDNDTNFINMGIAGSGYNGATAVNSLGTSLSPNDGYLYTQGSVGISVGNLVIGSNELGGALKIIAGGSDTANVAAIVTAPGTATTMNVAGGVTATSFTGNGAALTSITGANVTGNVTSAITAGTVTTNAQPNITSVGTLSSLAVTGNVSAGNLISAGTFQSATITSSSIAIPYTNTVPHLANVITLNGNTLWRSNSNIAANTPFAIGNTTNTWSMVQQWTKTSQAWYIDPINGLDTNDGSQVSPLQTIARGLVLAGGAGRSLILYPGTYTESITITTPNINFVGISLGSGVLLSGNITLNLTGSPTSSLRFGEMRLANVTVAGTGGGYYFDTCQIDQLTHSSTGYVELVDCEAESGLISVTAAGSIAAFQGNLRRLTIGNSSALATIHDVVFSGANIIVTAGTALVNNCIITAPTANANVITASAGTAVYVNYTGMTTTTGAGARVSIGGFYSFTGTIVDTANSVLGTNLNSVQVTDSLNVLNLANVAALTSRSTIAATGNITTATGNVAGGNLVTGGRVVATGNVVTSAQVVATGNVTGNFFIGNGSLLTNINGANVTSEVAVANTVSNPLQPNITALGTITSLTANAVTITGALTANGNAQFNGDVFFAGNVTIPGNINQVSGNSGQFFGNAITGFGALYAGLPAGYTLLTQEVMQYATNFNGYTQVTMRNISSGDQATGDFVVTADDGNDTTNFINMGFTGSGYNGLLANNSLGTSVFANDGYLYTQGNVAGGNLVLGSNQANGVVRIIANGASNIGDVVATFSAGGLNVNGNVTGNFFIGNGSQLTNLPVQSGTYGNANVTTLLSDNSVTSNIITSGNVSGSFILGNISQATGLGNISSVNLNGNVSTVLAGDGTFVAAVSGPSVDSIGSAATITPAATNTQYNVTALAESATIAAPSGSPVDGAKLTIRILDNGTAQTLTWNSIYQVIGTTLPATTVINKYVYVGCIYNSESSKWDVVSVAQEA
jgi:hypothetical protein